MRLVVLCSIFQVLAHATLLQTVEVDPPLPKRIGIVGVGTIGSAVARGILSSPAGHLPHLPKFVLSPRNAEKSAALKKEFPESVSIAASNQAVLDAVDCVVFAVPGSVAVDVIQSLQFRKDLQVISLIAAVNFTQLGQLVGPQVDYTLALPLPAVAKRQGATLGHPFKPFSQALFSALGSYVAAADEGQYKAMGVAGTLMGDFYMRQLTVQQWMAAQNVDASTASAFIGALFATIAADSANAGPSTFAAKVAEQTPHGLNEMVWKQQQAAGVYESLKTSLDAVYHRGKHTRDLENSLQVV